MALAIVVTQAQTVATQAVELEANSATSFIQEALMLYETPREDIDLVIGGTGSQPILVTGPEGEMGIQLPIGAESEMSEVRAGTHLIRTRSNANIAVVSKSGGVQILREIRSHTDPEAFPFELSGDFDTAKVVTNGAVFLLKRDGSLLGGFFPPWAHDANGRPVPTHFEIHGSHLVQIVSHQSAASLEYPVTFDPSYATGVLSKSSAQVYSGGGYQVSAWLSAWGRLVYAVDSRILAAEAWGLLKKNHWQAADSRWVDSLQQQWDCHITGGWLEWDSWDLETKRPPNPDWLSRIWNNLLTPAAVCNW